MEKISIYTVEDFVKAVNDVPALKDSRVIAMTHCKNAASHVLHEYLHILIAHPNGHRWTRLIAERLTDQDQVVIGLWPWAWSERDLRGGGYRGGSSSGGSSSGGSSSGGSANTGTRHDTTYDKPLPLLLRNVVFQPRLRLPNVAAALVTVRNRNTNYSLTSTNCYWYADGVFTLLKGKNQVNAAYSYSNTKDSWWAAATAVLNKLGRYLPWVPEVPMIAEMKRVANEYDEDLLTNPYRGAPLDGPDIPRQDIDPESLGKNTQDAEIAEDISTTDIMNQVGYAKHIDETATREEAKNLKKNLNEFTTAVLANSPEKEQDLEVYKSRINQEPPLALDSGPSELDQELAAVVEKLKLDHLDEEEAAGYEEALGVFVGSVLRELESKGITF